VPLCSDSSGKKHTKHAKENVSVSSSEDSGDEQYSRMEGELEESDNDQGLDVCDADEKPTAEDVWPDDHILVKFSGKS